MKKIQDQIEKQKKTDEDKKSGKSGGGKNAAVKEAEDEKKRLKELADEKKKIDDNLAETNDKRMKQVRIRSEATFKAITDAINDSKKAAEEFNKEIGKIDEQLGDINQSIGSRVITIETDLAGINKDLSTELDPEKQKKLNDEKIRLEQELALAKGSISAETLQKIRDEEAKSETQKLLDKRAVLETQKKDLEDKAAIELEVQAKLQSDRIALEESYTSRYHEELEKQTKVLSDQIDARVAKYRELEEAARRAGGLD